MNQPVMALLGMSGVALDDIAGCMAEKPWAPFVGCSQDTTAAGSFTKVATGQRLAPRAKVVSKNRRSTDDSLPSSILGT